MKILRDPLLQFLILGAALFAIYAMATGVFSSKQARRVEISASEVKFLVSSFERQWGREPTAEEQGRLLDARVREEILYREALAVGLDRNDVVVRRRMVQKMELLTQDLALMTDPTDEELRAFLDEHRDEYREPPRVSFSHVYFSPDRRGNSVEQDALSFLAQLRSQSPQPDRAPEGGDPIMLDNDYERATPREVSRLFGKPFADALFDLEPGWNGPVVSGFGLHLVHVGERVEGRAAEYEAVRDRLVDEFNRVRKVRANEALYRNLAQRYDVSVGERSVLKPSSGTAP